jgi:hydroxymethylglutaryl-CoA lyase
MLERSGIETGVSLPKIIETSLWLEEQLGRGVPAMLPKAGMFPDVARERAAAGD